MPSLSTYKISHPSDPQEFECLMRDFCDLYFQGHSVLYGRPGQKQYGVDIVTTCQDNRLIGIQCKNYSRTEITPASLDRMIREAEQFRPVLSRFVIATALDRDVALQHYIFTVSQQRVAEKRFPVDLLFWDDIQDVIKKDERLMKVYYPELYYGIGRVNDLGNNEYPNLILSEDEFRMKFLDASVRWNIREMMLVDPFAGFPVDLVIACDSFEICMDQMITRACTLNQSNTYREICTFMNALNHFTSVLARYADLVDEHSCRVMNPYALRDAEAVKRRIEACRRQALEDYHRAGRL